MSTILIRGPYGDLEVDAEGIPVDENREEYAHIKRVDLEKHIGSNVVELNKIGYWMHFLNYLNEPIYVEADDDTKPANVPEE